MHEALLPGPAVAAEEEDTGWRQYWHTVQRRIATFDAAEASEECDQWLYRVQVYINGNIYRSIAFWSVPVALIFTLHYFLFIRSLMFGNT